MNPQESLLLLAEATYSLFTITVPGSLWRNIDRKQHQGALLPEG